MYIKIMNNINIKNKINIYHYNLKSFQEIQKILSSP